MQLAKFYSFISILFIGLLGINSFFNYHKVLDLASLPVQQQLPIGHEFIAFKPILNRVRTAGYTTCRQSTNPWTDVQIMGHFQQAQFVLSPTILDIWHHMEHDVIIYECGPDTRLIKNIKRMAN